MFARLGLRSCLSSRAFSTCRTVLAEEASKQISPVAGEELVEDYHKTSGAPAELQTTRTVRIFQESKPATQSGTWGEFL
jgi:hypothetical protein